MKKAYICTRSPISVNIGRLKSLFAPRIFMEEMVEKSIVSNSMQPNILLVKNTGRKELVEHL